ncbi:MAG: branched-chain amino acid ABC transporter permease [Actinomycetota bacterium]|nr:branched-chain amino acid ABC transporter permease [Actinomycetota bacterium]
MPEWFDTNLVSVLNGLAIGCLLFILAVGLSLVFGMMDVLNLAHGAVFLVGAYAAYALTDGGATWPAFLGAAVVALAVGALCGGVLAGLSQPLARRGHLDQALLTLGAALILSELILLAFGNDVHAVGAPPGLDGSVELAGQSYPTYRLALIGVGLVLAVAVYLVVERTRLGALIRATVADRGMVEALGVDSRKVLWGVFAAGAAMAALAGVLGGPIYGARPGLDEGVLLLALVVVVIGGLGSIKGALIGALLIGQVESLGRALLPDLAPFLLFGTMALILVLRPRGLFGRAATGVA